MKLMITNVYKLGRGMLISQTGLCFISEGYFIGEVHRRWNRAGSHYQRN